MAQPDRSHLQALSKFTLDGTDHTSHSEQASMIRQYIIWRNRNANDRGPARLAQAGKRCLTRH
jgi:hypothetical protein